ncbi:MAG TPA: energy-coupling factor transporter transmembrane protein EcfT [Clostridiales bacterium]|nr:energy-coupling factor transporter transmembrane protein EcfT [Clostridiales bacterium]
MMKIRLDPRTKLYMVLIVSMVVLMPAATPLLWGIRIFITLFPIMLLLSEKRYKSAIRFLIFYGIAMVLTFFVLKKEMQGLLTTVLIGYCGIVVQFAPAIITAWYCVRTTKIDEFMSSMQRMHMPDGIAISLAVVMRFFPTIKEEYGSIRDAMKMRGISFGGGNALKMVEYRMIPLLFSCVNIGDELSAAALTRGLGGNVKRTSVVELRLRIWDILLMVLFTAALGIFVYMKYFG